VLSTFHVEHVKAAGRPVDLKWMGRISAKHHEMPRESPLMKDRTQAVVRARARASDPHHIVASNLREDSMS
jgi:hypothetical protein